MKVRLENVRRRLAKVDRHLAEAAERVTSRHPNKGTAGIDKQRALVRDCIVDVEALLSRVKREERDGVREEESALEPLDVDLDALRVSS